MAQAPKETSPQQADPRVANQRQELWLYVSVGIIAIVGLVTVAAVCYGIIAADTGADGVRHIRFPMLSWVAGIIALPSLLILAVHHAGVGLFETRGASAEEEAAWQKHLPERL